MKTLTQLFLVAAIAIASGCKDKPKANAPAQTRAPIANEQANYAEAGFQSAERPSSKPIGRQDAADPGQLLYLDAKNGFRDVTFGQTEGDIPNLVLKRSDEKRGVKTYIRTDDLMVLNDMPLSSIEYTFLKGELFQIVVKWTSEEKNAVLKNSPTKSLAPFCASLYGPAKHRLVKKDSAEYIWRGKKVELFVTETRLSGVPDTIHGGWAMPPSTRGTMIIGDIELRKALGAEVAAANGEKKDGL